MIKINIIYYIPLNISTLLVFISKEIIELRNQKINSYFAQILILKNMIIENEKVVGLSYVLRVKSNEGEVIESVDAEKPLNFIYGTGRMLPKFEENLAGLTVGDNFQFMIPCSEAYGPFTPEAIVDLPISIFVVNGELQKEMLIVNSVIPMQDNNGNHLNGTVLEVTDENVKMDFNHPLADEDLYFSGQVTEVREATVAELEHGHIHHECSGCGKH